MADLTLTISGLAELSRELRISPKRHCDYHVVGVTFEGRQKVLAEFFKTYKVGRQYDVVLMPENNNAYDPNAISVALEVNGKYQCVGYIPKELNQELRNKMNFIASSRLKSIGYGTNGKIGITIRVDFDDQSNSISDNQ